MSKIPRIVNVNITFKNLDATDALKSYANEKIENCIKKYVHHDTEAHVILKVEKNRQIAEADFNVDGANFKGSNESADMYASIDGLVETLSTQLRRHKDKNTKHH